ncbi:MAG: phosphatase PAP2 family protein [Chlamydiae bacterium]|nr:phosphatase PAP2 family protein [Chlamydiota bacterium]
MLFSPDLEFTKFLHQFRSPFLDSFFTFLNFFDTGEFLFILIPALWIGYNWKAGARLFYIILLSGLTNLGIKSIFLEPRPYQIDPSLAVIEVSGYSFPSGAAQTAILLSTLLVFYWKNKWKWFVALNFLFWVSLSRIYLGAHYPRDILAGWFVGFVLLLIFFYIFPLIEKLFTRISKISAFLLSIAPPILLMLIFTNKPVVRFASLALAAGIGIIVSTRYKIHLPLPKSTWDSILRTVIGVAGTFALYSLASLLPLQGPLPATFVKNFIIGLWLSLGASILCRRIFSGYKAKSI